MDKMSEEEAVKEVVRLNSLVPSWFCPLTADGVCRISCVCCREAHLERDSTPPHPIIRVQPPYCENKMFFGEE